MIHNEKSVLAILDAVGENSRVTQRELAQITGLNLAKVNALIREMATRGLVRLRNLTGNLNKATYLYLLTPSGRAEKSRLTLRAAKASIAEYERTVDALHQRLEGLRAIGGGRIVLIGAGALMDVMLAEMQRIDGLEVLAIVTSPQYEKERRGIPVTTSVSGLSYDWAVPCDDLAVDAGGLLKQVKIPKEKLWLM